MNKYEKAVLRACEARFERLMKDDSLSHPLDAIKKRRGERGKGVALIRAVARWQAYKRSARQPNERQP